MHLPLLPLGLATLAHAASGGTPTGTGPHPATWTTHPSLPSHVVYAPASPPSSLRLPVLIWGQGACSFNANTFDAFLKEVASHGIFILSNGLPNGPENPNGLAQTSNPDPSLHLAGLDWVTAHAGKGEFAQVDGSRVAVAGMSCGGIQSYAVQHDPRVTAIGIFNSGIKNQTEEALSLADGIRKPIFWFLGGPTDVAYPNGERDYTRVPKGTPKWKGNLPVGHGGDYGKKDGGKFAAAACRWLRWVLRGEGEDVRGYFEGTGNGTARGDGWDVVFEALDGIKVDKY